MNANGGLQSVGELESDAGMSRRSAVKNDLRASQRSAVRGDLRHTTNLNLLEATEEMGSNEDSDGDQFE